MADGSFEESIFTDGEVEMAFNRAFPPEQDDLAEQINETSNAIASVNKQILDKLNSCGLDISLELRNLILRKPLRDIHPLNFRSINSEKHDSMRKEILKICEHVPELKILFLHLSKLVKFRSSLMIKKQAIST